MNKNIMNKLIATGSVFGAIASFGACGSSATDPEGSGGAAGSGNAPASGGTAGSGNAPASGGAAGSGNAPASGGTGGTNGTAGSGGLSGSACGMGVTPVIREGSATGDGGAGGENGAVDVLCFPDIVCFGPSVVTPELSFVDHAFAFMGASGDGMPTPANASGVVTARVTYPEPGTVCMSGDDGAGLSLALTTGLFWDGMTLPVPNPATPRPPNFHAGQLGIAAVSFTLETPPSTGVGVGFITFGPPCGQVGGGDAERDGNPLVITSSGTITLLLTDFVSSNPAAPFDPDEIGGLNFGVGAGAYDYCIKDLRFLDANGNEVVP